MSVIEQSLSISRYFHNADCFGQWQPPRFYDAHADSYWRLMPNTCDPSTATLNAQSYCTWRRKAPAAKCRYLRPMAWWLARGAA